MTWAGAVLSVVGATILSTNLSYSWTGYWWMLIGSLLWLELSIRFQMWPSVFMWTIFSVINLNGIYRWTPW